ncbi:hypothetical protein TrRE_jg10377, partial [Triparma retinervis]
MSNESTFGRLGHDINRPRRQDPNDIIYLQGLPLAKDETDPEAAPMAARSALSSLTSNLASISGDERGSDLLEKCITIGLSLPPDSSTETKTDVLETLESTLTSLLPYTEFLSINRYGSHVLQSLLSILPPLYPLLPPTSTVLPSLLTIAETILPSLLEYATHIAGSHVLRSLICALGGVTPSTILPRRGKKGKHKHSGSSQTLTSSSSYPLNVPVQRGPSSAQLLPALDGLVGALLSKAGKKDKGYMQYLSCHSDASPVIMTMIRVKACVEDASRTPGPSGGAHKGGEANAKDANASGRTGSLQAGSYPSVSKGGVGERLVRAVLEADDPSVVGEVVYGLSGERLGSFVLEACMECYPEASTIVWKEGARGRAREFVDDDVGNYVVQGILQHMREGDGEVVGTLAGMIKGTLLKPNRMGVLFRLVQYAGRTGIGVEDVYNGVFGNASVPEILRVELPEKEGGRTSIDVNAARVVYWFTEGGFGKWGDKVVEGGIKTLGSAEVM